MKVYCTCHEFEREWECTGTGQFGSEWICHRCGATWSSQTKATGNYSELGSKSDGNPTQQSLDGGDKE